MGGGRGEGRDGREEMAREERGGEGRSETVRDEPNTRMNMMKLLAAQVNCDKGLHAWLLGQHRLDAQVLPAGATHVVHHGC